jgi:hypothetical protein
VKQQSVTVVRTGNSDRVVVRSDRRPYSKPGVLAALHFDTVALGCSFAPQEGGCGSGRLS